jgi:hypothetical protein
LKLEIPEARRAEGPERIWTVGSRGNTCQRVGKIQGKAEVEVLKHPKAGQPKSRESSICEGTLVTRSRAPGKVTLEFQFEN